MCLLGQVEKHSRQKKPSDTVPVLTRYEVHIRTDHGAMIYTDQTGQVRSGSHPTLELLRIIIAQSILAF
jgi:hypothetical protein